MLNIKIDARLKAQAKKIAEELGIPLGTIAVAFIRQFVRNKEVNLSIDLEPSRYLIDSIKEAEAEYKSGKLKSYKGTEELFKALKM